MKWFNNFYFCGNRADGSPDKMSEIFERKPHYQRLKLEHP
jgi:hypothetical protein